LEGVCCSSEFWRVGQLDFSSARQAGSLESKVGEKVLHLLRSTDAKQIKGCLEGLFNKLY
jgi:hypothetical protein